MSDAWFRRAVVATLSVDDYGRTHIEQPERVQVEFVSANPTGPANAATGRHAAYGDSLARILSFVERIVSDIDKSDKRPTYTVAKSEA